MKWLNDILRTAACAGVMMLPVLFSACSDSDDSNDDGGDGTADSGLVKIAYTADRTSENIFGQMNFGMTFARSGGDGSVSMADVRESYDSIVWKVVETGRSFKLMDNVHMTMQWGHCFYLPGSYTTYVVGYKADREIFRTESVALKVTDNNDFLCWNWNEITGNEGNTGYENVLDGGFQLSVNTVMNGGVTGAELMMWNDGHDDNVFYDTSVNALYAYLTQLCGAPLIDSGSSELQDAYAGQFAYHHEGATPLALWHTAKARIVLLGIDREGLKLCRAYAEPL